MGPSEVGLRERLSALASGFIPHKDEERAGIGRLLAVLDFKALTDGGASTDRERSRFIAGRKSAFRECAHMLRAILDEAALRNGETGGG